MGPNGGHPKAVRFQFRVEGLIRHLNEVRRQTQALKLALSVALGIGHVHLLEEVSGRTPYPVLSVVHTTERNLRILDGAGRVVRASRHPGVLFCSDGPRQSCDNVLKALAEI